MCSESTVHFWHGLGQIPDSVSVRVIEYTSNDPPVFIVGAQNGQSVSGVWTNFQAGATATLEIDVKIESAGDDRIREVTGLSHLNGGQTVKQGTPDLRFYDFGTRQAAI